jgi:choline dehydrogenase
MQADSVVADFVVAGGGTAGCVIAARLAGAGHSVVVIEAGPDYGPRGDQWPTDLLEAASLPTSHDWGYAGVGAGGQPLMLDRAKVIGGCSTHNGCSQMVGWAGDYDAWAANSPGWSAAELRPLFATGSTRMRLRHFAEDEIQPFHREFLRACAGSGLALTHDFVDLDGGAGAGCPPVNIEQGTRINAAFAYLDEVRQHPLVQVLADTMVDRVLLEQGRAVGVAARERGQSVVVRADQVILAGGAYGTPAMLQRSGIGDPDQLLAAGVTPKVSLPGVGRNLHDHPAAEIEFRGTARLAAELDDFARERWLPEEQAVAKLRSPNARGPYDLHVYPWVERAEENGAWRCIFPVALLTPRSRGTVTIVSADPEQPPAIHTAYFSDPDGADLAGVRWGVRWTTGMVGVAGLAGLLGPKSSGPGVEATDADIDRWIQATHAHYWHPAGTAKMGPEEDSASVVDFAGRVHGVPGLRVADACVFPALPRATPALPTVIVGERIARFVLSGE